MSNGFGKVMKFREGLPTPEVIAYGYDEITGLTLDRKRNTLYWYDAKSKT